MSSKKGFEGFGSNKDLEKGKKEPAAKTQNTPTPEETALALERAKKKEQEELERREKRVEDLIDELSNPKYVRLTLYLIRRTRDTYELYAKKIKKVQKELKPGPVFEQNYQICQNKIDDVPDCLAVLESTEWLIVNYYELKKADNSSFNTFILAEVMYNMQVILDRAMREFSIKAILSNYFKENEFLLYQVAIGMVLFSAEIANLAYKSSEVAKKYESQTDEVRPFQTQFLKECSKFYMEIEEKLLASKQIEDQDSNREREELEALEESASFDLTSLDNPRDIKDSVEWAAHTYFSIKPSKEKHKKLTGERIPATKVEEMLNYLLERVQKFEKIIDKIISNKGEEFPILKQKEQAQYSEISKILGEKIMLGINKFSLPRLQGLQITLLTSESNNGYWRELLESLDENVGQIKLEHLTDQVKNTLISLLQSQIEKRMSGIDSQPSARAEFLDLVSDFLESCFSSDNQASKDNFIQLIESLDENSILDQNVKAVLNYIQNETGAPFLLENTQGQKYLGRWFLHFKDDLVKLIKKNQTSNSEPKNALGFIENNNSDSSSKVRFEVANTDKNNLLYSGNSTLQRLSLRRLKAVKECGGLGNLVDQVARRGAISFGCHRLKNIETSWFKEGDIVLDTGSAVRMILSERQSTDGRKIVTIEGLFDYHDLLK